MSFVVASKLDDLWCGEMRGVSVEGRPVLLVHVDGCVRAFADECAHQRARLSEGRLEGHEIVCPLHEWRYDARTGIGTNPVNARLRPIAVRLEGELILVDVVARAWGAQ